MPKLFNVLLLVSSPILAPSQRFDDMSGRVSGLLEQFSYELDRCLRCPPGQEPDFRKGYPNCRCEDGLYNATLVVYECVGGLGVHALEGMHVHAKYDPRERRWRSYKELLQ